MRGLFAFLAALALAQPAAAADPAGLTCPLDGAPKQVRDTLGAGLSAPGSLDNAALTAFAGAVERCAVDQGWNEVESESARQYGLSLIGLEALRPLLAADGIDLAALERLLAVDSGLAAAVRSPEFQESDVQQFAQRNGPAIRRLMGAKAEDETAGNRIGRFIAAHSIARAASIRFSGR